MNRLEIDLEALRHNVETIDGWMRGRGARWTLVTKALCGERTVLRALRAMGVRSVAESRLANLVDVREALPKAELWYLRPPHPSAVHAVAAACDVSLNSEIETVRLLDEAAAILGRRHRVLAMVEMGDLREGVLPAALPAFCEEAARLRHIELIGIGANFGCLAGVVPTVDHLEQLLLFHELARLKTRLRLPIVSAGTSVALPLLLAGQVPVGINHFRIGEAVFLGTDLIAGKTIPGLRDDVVVLRAEIAELKRKPLCAAVAAGDHVQSFAGGSAEHAGPVDARGWRAIVSIGRYDTDIDALTPIDPRLRVAGASSDMLVINVGEDAGGLRVGEEIAFRLGYAALLRLMGSRYIAKRCVPDGGVFSRRHPRLELAQETVTRREQRRADVIPMHVAPDDRSLTNLGGSA